MKTDKLSIEYIVIGSLSLIWILPLGHMLFPKDVNYGNIELDKVLLAIPFTYVIGMTLDHFGAEIFRSWKDKIKNESYLKYDYEKIPYYKLMIEKLSHNEELLKQFETRNSRVRIARGLVLNLLFALILSIISSIFYDELVQGVIVGTVLIFLITGSYQMWKKKLELLYKYQSYLSKFYQNM